MSTSKDNRQKMIDIVNGILQDDKFWDGGIPDVDQELIHKFGFTEKQASIIEITLFELCTKKLAKKIN